MTPHTLVGGAQTTLTATASARADRRDWPSEAWGPRDKTHTPPLGALDRGRAGATGAVGMAHNISWSPPRRPGWERGQPLSHAGDSDFCHHVIIVSKPLQSALFLDGERCPSDGTCRGFGTTPWVSLARHLWLQSSFEFPARSIRIALYCLSTASV